MENLITDAWKWFGSFIECYKYAISVVGGTGAIVWFGALGRWGVKPKKDKKKD